MAYVISFIVVLTLFFTRPASASILADPQAVDDPSRLLSVAKNDVPKFSVDKFFMIRNMIDADWSPDGKQIVFNSNISGRCNLWTMPASGGWPIQLTFSNQRQYNPAWSPDGKWIVFQSDYDGNEQWDLFLVSTQNGEIISLTNTADVSEEGPVWSPDGKQIAYAVKPKSSSVFEIFVMDLQSRKTRQITSNTPANYINIAPIWSPDGKFLAFTREEAKATDRNVFLADLESGKLSCLSEHDGEKTYTANDFSSGGKYLLITSNAKNGYENCALLDLSSKKLSWLTDEKWEVHGSAFSPDSKAIVFTGNVDGNKDIYFLDLKTKEARQLACAQGVNTPIGAQSPFSHDGERLLYLHDGPNAPDDIWVYDTASGKSKQLTDSLVAGLKCDDLVVPQLVHYPSRDGKWQISAFVYLPYNCERNGKNKAVVWVHGGPTSQAKNSYNKNIQFLVNQGYLVLTPNYRGSTGYGEDFKRANLFDMGGGDFQDVLAGADWLKKSGFVDPSKMVIMGASYGGYMTMMALTKAPEMFAAGVAIVPFVNWFTEVENEDPALAQWDLASMGDPVKNKALWEDRSPINFVDNIKVPLLMIAGGNDTRCPKTEAEQVMAAVKKRAGIAELKVYDNEGHSFSKIENQLDYWRRIHKFLQEHMN